MSTKQVNLEDFPDVLAKFTELSLDRKRKAVVRGLQRSIPDLVAASPVDTGLYAASWDVLERELSALVVNYAPYAGVIEHGARPHKMPIAPLLAWAKRVTQSKSQPPDYDSQVWALAKATQNKIAEFGQAPKHVMENLIPLMIENIRKELKNV